MESQPTHGSQAKDEGGIDTGAGGGGRAEGEGNARQNRTSATAGHPNVGERGREQHRITTRGRRGERGEEGDESDATRGGDVEKSRKNGKRLGHSLRTHPQPEHTTLSVLSMKDLPA